MDDDPAMVGDPIMAAVAFMIARPGSADRVLRNHARNDSGHCRRCRYQLRPQRWPCTVAGIALLAREALEMPAHPARDAQPNRR